MLADFLCQRPCSGDLLFGIAGLDVHRHHEVDEPQVLRRDFVSQSAVLQQFRVAVSIARVIVVSRDIVGFQGFLYGLVTEESHVELMSCLVQVLSCADILVYVVEPLLDDVFSCHLLFALFVLTAAKVRFYFELLHFTSLKVQKGGRM